MYTMFYFEEKKYGVQYETCGKFVVYYQCMFVLCERAFVMYYFASISQ